MCVVMSKGYLWELIICPVWKKTTLSWLPLDSCGIPGKRPCKHSCTGAWVLYHTCLAANSILNICAGLAVLPFTFFDWTPQINSVFHSQRRMSGIWLNTLLSGGRRLWLLGCDCLQEQWQIPMRKAWCARLDPNVKIHSGIGLVHSLPEPHCFTKG